MPDVDDFMSMTVLELLRRGASFSVVRKEGDWKLTLAWKEGQLDPPTDEAKPARK